MMDAKENIEISQLGNPGNLSNNHFCDRVLTRSHTKSLPSPPLRLGIHSIKENVDSSLYWMKNAIDPASLPQPNNKRYKNRCFPSRGMKNKLKSEKLLQKSDRPILSLDNEELNKIYGLVVERNGRYNHGKVSPTPTTESSPSTRKVQQVTKQTVDDIVSSVVLQYDIQALKSRISKLPVGDRPVPETVDPDLLGHELQMRLAKNTPALEAKLKQNMEWEFGTAETTLQETNGGSNLG